MPKSTSKKSTKPKPAKRKLSAKQLEYRKRRLAWADALESGEYQQTQQQLRDGRKNAFCCLGVACEVYRKETGVGRWSADGVFRIGTDDGYDLGLPPTVAEWFGLEGRSLGSNELSPLLGAYYAHEWNDDKGATFADIAKMVRKL